MYYDELHGHLHKGEQSKLAFPHLQCIHFPLQVHFIRVLHALDISAVVIHTGSQIVFILHPYSDGKGLESLLVDHVPTWINVRFTY